MTAAAVFFSCLESDILKIENQGSFASGGKILTDSLGRSYHGDYAYVFYQIPVNARKYPLVFAHGAGQFSKTWETPRTAEEAFRIFFAKKFSVYLVNQPHRGNAGRSKGALEQFFRHMTPNIGSADFEVYS